MPLLLYPSQPVLQGRLHQLLLFVRCYGHAAATMTHASAALLLRLLLQLHL
jgi:hypothetical protein